jgi:hypothetical protein
MATFIDLGALWLPRPGGKAALSGQIHTEEMHKAVGQAGSDKNIRVFVQKNTKKTGGSQPDYRLVAVFEGEDDAHSKRASVGRENEERRESNYRRTDRDSGGGVDRDPGRDRPGCGGVRSDRSERDLAPFQATDEDVPF